MPYYNFKNNETGEIFTLEMKMADRETYLSANPNITQLISTTRIGDPISLGIRKPDKGFNNLLRAMKKGHPGSTIEVND